MNLPPLFLNKFIFTLEALEDMRLPEYKGSMFRGAFGITFRRIVCITKQNECAGCILTGSCSYFKVFETERHNHSIPFLKGVEKVPHPFLLNPPEDTRRDYKKGDRLEVELVLFGEIVNLLPFFVITFSKLGETGISYKRSKLKLVSVTALEPGGGTRKIYDPASGSLDLTATPLTLPDEAPQSTSAEVTFITPMRLQEKGRLITSSAYFSPGLLFRSLQRRYLLISHFYCGGNLTYPDPFDSSGLTVKSSSLVYKDWERYSNRQKQKMSLGGLTGTVVLNGTNEFFNRLLSAGTHINAGKNTVFGLGKMKVEFSAGTE